MKKIFLTFLLFTLVNLFVFSVDFEFSGEIKTGFYTEQIKDQSSTRSKSVIHNNDGDSGEKEARIRLNFSMEYKNIGMRTRYTQITFRPYDIFQTEFVYAYADIFSNQLKVSAGMLGESPWGTKGPDLWVDVDNLLGIRFEWTPNFLPGLNLGFVVNRYNATGQQIASMYMQNFYDLLMDSVLGIAYDTDYFAFNFAYRFDSDADWAFNGNEGAAFVYRAEEKLLRRFIPGFQIWLNGHYFGIGSVENEREFFENWAYIFYYHANFTANLNVKHYYNVKQNGQTVLYKPTFLYKLFDNFLNIGLGLGLETGYGTGRNYSDSVINYWYLEPQVRVNLNSNAYLAILYNFTDKFENIDGDKSATHWLNIRLCYNF